MYTSESLISFENIISYVKRILEQLLPLILTYKHHYILTWIIGWNTGVMKNTLLDQKKKNLKGTRKLMRGVVKSID